MYFGIHGIEFEEIRKLEDYVSEYILDNFDGDETGYIDWVDKRSSILADVLQCIEKQYGSEVKDKSLSKVGYDVRYHFADGWNLHDLEGAYVKKSSNLSYEELADSPDFKDTDDYKKYVEYWNDIPDYDLILFSDLNRHSDFNTAILDLMAEAYLLSKDFELGSNESAFIELCDDKCIVHDRYRKAHTKNMKRAEENLRSKRMKKNLIGLR